MSEGIVSIGLLPAARDALEELESCIDMTKLRISEARLKLRDLEQQIAEGSSDAATDDAFVATDTLTRQLTRSLADLTSEQVQHERTVRDLEVRRNHAASQVERAKAEWAVWKAYMSQIDDAAEAFKLIAEQLHGVNGRAYLRVQNVVSVTLGFAAEINELADNLEMAQRELAKYDGGNLMDAG